jgi:hypothetical protein
MARKVEHVTIELEGRDQGKVFVLTEMPATLGKPWLMKVTTLLAVQGMDIKALGKAGGVAALAMVMDDPILTGWRDCVKYQHEGQMPQAIFWDKPTCQIEEIETVTFLQAKVLELHMGFTPPVSPSTTG